MRQHRDWGRRAATTPWGSSPHRDRRTDIPSQPWRQWPGGRVFGIVYGTVAAPVLGSGPTVLSSVLVFSGAAQFAMLALRVTGAEPVSVLWSVLLLNLRFLVLGAVLPSAPGGRWWPPGGQGWLGS